MTEGRKDDHGKTRWDLLPLQGIEQVARVSGYGAGKYGEDNWRAVSGWRRRYVAAAFRHLYAHCTRGGLAGGLPLDEESGLPHLAHAAISLLFVLELAHQEGDKS